MSHTFLWVGLHHLSSSALWELGHHGPHTWTPHSGPLIPPGCQGDVQSWDALQHRKKRTGHTHQNKTFMIFCSSWVKIHIRKHIYGKQLSEQVWPRKCNPCCHPANPIIVTPSSDCLWVPHHFKCLFFIHCKTSVMNKVYRIGLWLISVSQLGKKASSF